MVQKTPFLQTLQKPTLSGRQMGILQIFPDWCHENICLLEDVLPLRSTLDNPLHVKCLTKQTQRTNIGMQKSVNDRDWTTFRTKRTKFQKMRNLNQLLEEDSCYNNNLTHGSKCSGGKWSVRRWCVHISCSILISVRPICSFLGMTCSPSWK